MGYEKGTVFFYNEVFWLFNGYSSDKDHNQTLILHGLNGEEIEAKEKDCIFVISPSEMNF